MTLSEKKTLENITRALSELGHPSIDNQLSDMIAQPGFMLNAPLTILETLCCNESTAVANRRMVTNLKSAHLAGCDAQISSCVDSVERTYFPDGITEVLADMSFVNKGFNVAIFGPSGVGKTYLAKAIGVQACATVRCEYTHCSDVLEHLASLKADSFTKYERRKRALIRLPLLIFDDFLLHPVVSELERHLLFDIFEGRAEARLSTLICSQRTPERWASMLGSDQTIADAIIARTTRHYSIRIQQHRQVDRH